MRVVKIFIDGFGLGEPDPSKNAVVAARTPCFDSLLEGHSLWGNSKIITERATMIPLDATLGVSGVPQSATGQTTLWTGINAARAAGRHVNAFPNDLLRKIIAENSIFKSLAQKGYKGTFANAFRPNFFEAWNAGKRDFSTSTLSAKAGGMRIRNLEDLLRGRAVYQDITNEILQVYGFDVPLCTPWQAGKNLARIARDHDFTLFEFFQSDVAGHKRDMERCVKLVERIDEFVGAVLEHLPMEDSILLLTSDHGNLEDLSIPGHTTNPVPLLIVGNYHNIDLNSLRGIEDIVPLVMKVVQGESSSDALTEAGA